MKTETKGTFTVGTWKVGRFNDLSYTITTETQSDEYLPDSEDEANAKLIANAPIMRNALEFIFTRFPSYGIKPHSEIYEAVANALLKSQ